MKTYSFICAALFAAVSAFGADFAVSLKAVDKFSPPPPDSVRLKGFLGGVLDTSMKGVMAKDVDMLVYPFRLRAEKGTWKSEFWGKWFTSAAWAYDYKASPKLDGILKYATAELIKTQDAQGAIRTVAPDYEFKLMGSPTNWENMTWDVWGRKYTLLGLLAEYARTSDPAALNAAKRHADYIIAHIGEGKKDICDIGMWFGVASSSILEPVALLYQYTGEKRYLDFANYIIENQHKSKFGMDFFRKMRDGWVITDVFPKPGDKVYGRYAAGGSKAYETTSCFEGLLEMYRITGNPDYLKASENLASSVRDTETLITGSSSINEKWRCAKLAQHSDTEKWQETCVSATWLKFCTQLLRLTGKSIYAGDIELTAYNALSSAQNGDGSWWCHNSPINGTRVAARQQCLPGEGIWSDRSAQLPGAPKFVMNCCVASGPRGLFTIPKSAYMTFNGGIVVNIYENGSAALPVNGSLVGLSVSGLQWGKTDAAQIKIYSGAPSKFTLKLYIPQWSKNTKVSVNSVPVAAPAKAGEYLDIARVFKTGDVVEIKFDAAVVVNSIPGHSDILYLKYGPFVLSMDKRFEPDFDKPANVADFGGVVKDARRADVDGVALAFDVPLRDGTTRRFINYSNAGATWDNQSSFATMFMRWQKIKYSPLENLPRAK